MSTQPNDEPTTASNEVLVCSACDMPLRRDPEGLLVHLEPWCPAMMNGEHPGAAFAVAKVLTLREEPNDWQHITPPSAAARAAFRDIMAAGREVNLRLLWPEGGSDDSQ